jgi:hypothetical protein
MMLWIVRHSVNGGKDSSKRRQRSGKQKKQKNARQDTHGTSLQKIWQGRKLFHDA